MIHKRPRGSLGRLYRDASAEVCSKEQPRFGESLDVRILGLQYKYQVQLRGLLSVEQEYADEGEQNLKPSRGL